MRFKKALSLLIAVVFLFSVCGGAMGEIIAYDYNPVGQSLAATVSPYLEEGGHESADFFLTMDDFASHKLTLINIWSNGCGPCHIEMPYLQRIHEEYGDQGILVVGGVTTWIGGNFAQEYDYLQSHGYTYMNVVPDDVLLSLYQHNNYVPQTFIVSSEGIVIDFIGGSSNYETFVQKIGYWTDISAPDPTSEPTPEPTPEPTQSATITIGTICNAHPGEEVLIPLSIIANMEYEANSLFMHVTYDSTKLTVTGYTEGDLFYALPMNAAKVFDYATCPGDFGIGILCSADGFTGSGTLLNIKFRVADDCTEDQPVNVTVSEFIYSPIGGGISYIPYVIVPGSVNLSSDPIDSPEHEITELYVDGFTAPIWGEHPDYEVNVPVGSNYTIDYVDWNWFDFNLENGNVIPVSGTYNNENYVYYMYFEFLPAEGYTFAENVTVYVNGDPSIILNAGLSAYYGYYWAYTIDYTVSEPLFGGTLTINYVYEDGTEAAPAYTEVLAEGAAYSVKSPFILLYDPDVAVVEGVMPNADVTVTVTYATKSFYSVTYNGAVVDASDKAVGDTFNWTYSVSEHSYLWCGQWLIDYPEEYITPVNYSVTWSGGLQYQIGQTWDNEEAWSDKVAFVCNRAYEGQTGAAPVGDAGNWYSQCGMFLTSFDYYGVQMGGNCVRITYKIIQLPSSDHIEQDENGSYFEMPIYVIESQCFYGIQINSSGVYSCLFRPHDEIITVPGKVYVNTVSTNEYTVAFLDWDNTVLKEQIVVQGEAATAPDDPTRIGYTFTGWDKEFDCITEDTTIHATYTINIYIVTYTGVYTSSVGVEHGGSITLPVLDVPGLHYTFTVNGEPWDGTNITEDVTVYVDFAEDIYAVSFFDGLTGEVLAEKTAYYGDAVAAPEPPEHENYTFVGWDSDFSYVTSDMVVTAIYAPVNFTVTFTDGNGNVIETQSVPYLGAAVPPAEPQWEGWIFVGWDADFSCVEGDMTVNAVWERVFCTVSFTGSYIADVAVEYGGDVELPVYNSATICYTFTANGQDFCPENITEDVTVIVSAALIRNTYHTVTFVGMDGEVLSVQSVLHGQAAEAPEAPEIEGYTFVGWDRDNFGCVTYSMVRTAVYEETGFCVPGDVDGDGVFSFTDISSLSLFLIGAGNIENELSADYTPTALSTLRISLACIWT